MRYLLTLCSLFLLVPQVHAAKAIMEGIIASNTTVLFSTANAFVGLSTGIPQSRLHIYQGQLTQSATSQSAGPVLHYIQRADNVQLFQWELSGGVNNDNLTLKNNPKQNLISFERATSRIIPGGALFGTTIFTSSSQTNGTWNEYRRADEAKLFRLHLTGGVNSDNMTWVNDNNDNLLSLERASARIGINNKNPSVLVEISSGTVAINGSLSQLKIGTMTISGTTAPPNSQALCLSAGSLGHCTDAVSATGSCTCVTP